MFRRVLHGVRELTPVVATRFLSISSLTRSPSRRLIDDLPRGCQDKSTPSWDVFSPKDPLLREKLVAPRAPKPCTMQGP